MSLSGTFWAPFFKDQCIKRIEYYVDTLEKRILPVYQNIEQEADKVSNDKWEEYMSMPGDGSTDPSELAERAFDEGLEYFLIIAGQKQALLNLSATMLYHLIEQHFLFFHRKQLLLPGEKENERLICIKEFIKRIRKHNIDIETFSSWDIFEEIRLVNNAVKHAEGKSSSILKQKRPDLFQHPESVRMISLSIIPKSWVYLPLAGEDLYVSLDDLKKYKIGLISLIKEFINAICSE